MEVLDYEMVELTAEELDEVNGAFLVNVGMGIVGAMGGMATYSLAGGIAGNLTLGGFAGAATSGFVFGASGFNSVGGLAGAAAGGVVQEWVDSEETTDE